MKKKKFEVVVSMNSYHTYIVEASNEDAAYEAVMSGKHDPVEIEPQDDPCLEGVNPIEG
jgi:hypothetical protein